jgi:hypothetical protein
MTDDPKNTEQTKKRGRPPGKPKIETFIDLIKSGEFDDHLTGLQDALDYRRDQLKEGVLERVREVFGPEARVSLPDDSPLSNLFRKTAEAKKLEPDVGKNPFIEKKRPAPEIADPQVLEDDDQIIEALPEPEQPQPHSQPPYAPAGTGGIPPVVARINEGEQPPIEQRGAIIGGLSSGDIE